MPLVQRRDDVSEWVLSEAKKHLTKKPRIGIHVSDLILPRKAYWGKVMPMPLTDVEALYFIAGRAHEDIVVSLAGLGRYAKKRGEWLGTDKEPYQPDDGIKYEIDLAAPLPSAWLPIEFKTNRRPTIIMPEDVPEQYGYYLEQLGSYTSITWATSPGTVSAYLAVLHLMARNIEGEEGSRQSRPMLVVYQIDWTPEELQAILDNMQEGRRLLELAVSLKDHTILKECPNWMCGRVDLSPERKCPNCGRVYTVGEEKPDGAKRGAIRKCEDCQIDGKRPDLLTDERFMPMCKFWNSCKPDQWSKYHDTVYKP